MCFVAADRTNETTVVAASLIPNMFYIRKHFICVLLMAIYRIKYASSEIFRSTFSNRVILDDFWKNISREDVRRALVVGADFLLLETCLMEDLKSESRLAQIIINRL